MSSDFSNALKFRMENAPQGKENDNIGGFNPINKEPDEARWGPGSQKRRKMSDVVVIYNSDVEMEEAPITTSDKTPEIINAPHFTAQDNAFTGSERVVKAPQITKPRDNTDVYIGVLSNHNYVPVFASRGKAFVGCRVFFGDLPSGTSLADCNVGGNGRVTVGNVDLDPAVLDDAVLQKAGVVRSDLDKEALKAKRLVVSTYYSMVTGIVDDSLNKGDGVVGEGDAKARPLKASTTPKVRKSVTFDGDDNDSSYGQPTPKSNQQQHPKPRTVSSTGSAMEGVTRNGKVIGRRVGCLKSDNTTPVFVSLSTHTHRTPYVLYNTEQPKGRWKWEDVEFLPAYDKGSEKDAKNHFRSLLAAETGGEGDDEDSDAKGLAKTRKIAAAGVSTSADGNAVDSSSADQGRASSQPTSDRERPVEKPTSRNSLPAKLNNRIGTDSPPAGDPVNQLGKESVLNASILSNGHQNPFMGMLQPVPNISRPNPDPPVNKLKNKLSLPAKLKKTPSPAVSSRTEALPYQPLRASPLAQPPRRLSSRKPKPRISLEAAFRSDSDSDMDSETTDDSELDASTREKPTRQPYLNAGVGRISQQPLAPPDTAMAESSTQDTQALLKKYKHDLDAANRKIAYLERQLAATKLNQPAGTTISQPADRGQSGFTIPPSEYPDTVTFEDLTYTRDVASITPGLLVHRATMKEEWGGKQWVAVTVIQDMDIVGGSVNQVTRHTIEGKEYLLSKLANGREVLVRQNSSFFAVGELEYCCKRLMMEVKDNEGSDA